MHYPEIGSKTGVLAISKSFDVFHIESSFDIDFTPKDKSNYEMPIFVCQVVTLPVNLKKGLYPS